MIRTPYVKFQISTTILPQGNLTSGCEIKQHIWQWKYKEGRSRSAVRCHNFNGNGNNIKWGTIISQKCHYFLHNLTAPWCACLILARFSQLTWQKLGSWIILAVELVTLKVLCPWTKSNSPLGNVSTICWVFQTAKTPCVCCILYAYYCAQRSYLMTDVHAPAC